MNTFYNQALHRYAVFAASCTFVLLNMGALVTSNDAGLSIPDWPLAYGSFVPPFVGGIRYEYSHRVFAAFVGVLTVVLAAWLWRAEKRQWMRWLGLAALGGVIAQGILGGLTVRTFQLPPVSAAHGTLAQLFFSTLVSIAVFTSAWWQGELPEYEDTGSPRVRTLVFWSGIPAQGIWNYSAPRRSRRCYNPGVYDGRGAQEKIFRCASIAQLRSLSPHPDRNSAFAGRRRILVEDLQRGLSAADCGDGDVDCGSYGDGRADDGSDPGDNADYLSNGQGVPCRRGTRAGFSTGGPLKSA
jgi:hypothetical protein